jgi:NTE family protein
VAATSEFIKQIENKRIGVVLSSGFFSFWAHAGFIKALEEYKITPKAYSGCSAGAIVAAFKASGLETKEMLERFQDLNRNMFWDPEVPPKTLKFLLHGFRGFTGYLRGRKFRKLIKHALPVKKFQDCESGLYIVATNLTKNRREVFSKGDIARAVHASGAVPLMFRSVKIKGNYYIDGALVDKAPIRALAENQKLDGIIVNYIKSKSLKKEPNWFLNKKLTPWHIYSQSFDILRQHDFFNQVEWARDRGIKVWIVSPKLPSMGPFKMDKGMKSFKTGYKSAKKSFKTNKFMSDKKLRSLKV